MIGNIIFTVQSHELCRNSTSFPSISFNFLSTFPSTCAKYHFCTFHSRCQSRRFSYTSRERAKYTIPDVSVSNLFNKPYSSFIENSSKSHCLASHPFVSSYHPIVLICSNASIKCGKLTIQRSVSTLPSANKSKKQVSLPRDVGIPAGFRNKYTSCV